jgi:serine/threonine-protein kinase
VTGPQAADAGELGVGDRLGPYVIEARLGHGATGIVFRAVREGDGESVALKVLRRPLSADEQFVRRFLREAAVARAVSHSHLVPIVDAGEVEGRHYLASKYVEGGSLRERLDEAGMLPLDEVARLAAGIGAALDALHEAELVHRDVKPSNVMLTVDGRALLADFGLAKGPAHSVVTRPGELMGTPAYMAPELISGEEATPSTDLYALGCVLYECVTGAPPFSSPSLVEMIAARLVQEPPDPSDTRAGLRPSLGSALGRALALDPSRRPPTGVALAHLVGFAVR